MTVVIPPLVNTYLKWKFTRVMSHPETQSDIIWLIPTLWIKGCKLRFDWSSSRQHAYCERAAARGRKSRSFTYAFGTHCRHSHLSQVRIPCRTSRCFPPSLSPTAGPSCSRLCQGCIHLLACMQSRLISPSNQGSARSAPSSNFFYVHLMPSPRCSAGYKRRLILHLAGTPPTGR